MSSRKTSVLDNLIALQVLSNDHFAVKHLLEKTFVFFAFVIVMLIEKKTENLNKYTRFYENAKTQ